MARSSESNESLLIGELADRTGASRRSLRHYEQRGLIRPQRSGNGYRRYDPQTVGVVQRIRSLLHLGLPLATVEALLPCALVDQLAFEPCPELRAMLRARLERIDAAAEDLARDRAVVAVALEQADAGETWTGEPTSSTDTTPPPLRSRSDDLRRAAQDLDADIVRYPHGLDPQ